MYLSFLRDIKSSNVHTHTRSACRGCPSPSPNNMNSVANQTSYLASILRSRCWRNSKQAKHVSGGNLFSFFSRSLTKTLQHLLRFKNAIKSLFLLYERFMQISNARLWKKPLVDSIYLLFFPQRRWTHALNWLVFWWRWMRLPMPMHFLRA